MGRQLARSRHDHSPLGCNWLPKSDEQSAKSWRIPSARLLGIQKYPRQKQESSRALECKWQLLSQSWQWSNRSQR
jgi:hypothetical protein